MAETVLNSRVAVVTGGASGIGRACVLALAEAGANVAISYHQREAEARDLVGQVEALGRKAIAVRADVGLESDVDRSTDEIVSALGVPDILVNSAGLNMSGVKVSEMDTAQWTRLVATDLTGSFFTSRRFIRDLVARNGPAAIINITSIHSFAMRDGAADYDSAKAGQTALTRTLAIEVAGRGITVNAIAPGMILTPMNQRALDDIDYRRKLEANIPARRAGLPEEVAGLVVFLASPAGAYITGTEIVIDGGLSLIQATGA